MRPPAIAMVPLLIGLAACSLFKSKPPPPPPRPLYVGRTATLEITNGIGVIGAVELPSGFTPRFESPPMWLAQGTEVGVAGTLRQKAVVLGFHGDRLSHVTTLASDFGAGAPNGRILEVAASPDGMELATAAAVANDTAAPPSPAMPSADDEAAATDLQRVERVDLMVIDSISGGRGHAVASFDGDYRVTSLQWLDRTTIAIVIEAAARPARNTAKTADPARGLYIVGISGMGSIVHYDQIKCSLRRLSFSPNRRFAVSEGDPDTGPRIVDLRGQTCDKLPVSGPIRILGWAPDSSAMLYAASDRDGKNTGVFRYNAATARRTLIAVSSAAAAYTSDGTIIALGNGQLSWKRVAQDPMAPIKAEIALLNPLTAVVTINSLGFETPPEMFARSLIVFSVASDDAAIETFVPTSGGLLRELIDYSYPARNAFVLASGTAPGPLTMSWAADGRALAIVDSDGADAKLTVLIPPQ